jgi:hypothetical protein
MPAVGLVVAAVASYSGVAATIAVSLEAMGASALVASVGSGVIVGAGTGAITSAIQGGDIAKGALIGGITGGVGAGVSNVIGGALSLPGVGEYGPQLATGSPALDAGILKGVTGAVTGGLGAGLSGGDPLRGALLGGATGGISGAAGQALGLGSTGTSALGGALGFGLSAAFPTSKETQRAGVSAQTPYQPTVSAPKAAGSSAALGNALSIAPGMGYSPSSTVFGSGESDKPKSNVWNVESLKGGAEVGPNVS